MYIPTIGKVDSYKLTHHEQLRDDVTNSNSYIEARVPETQMITAFGLQMYIKDHLLKPITKADVDELEDIAMGHIGVFNRAGMDKIVDKYEGMPPVFIEGVPEGTVLPASNALVQVRGTHDPEDHELKGFSSYLETQLHRAIWYPTSVATNSRMAKEIIYTYLRLTADDPDAEIDFKLHDFGGRGVSSSESAGIGGLAHLVNFKGTDTVEALYYARRFYNERMAGFSIPASEHSTMTSWGGPAGEAAAFENMLDKFLKPGKMVACVSDSYDVFHACSELWGNRFKQRIIDSGGTLVVRPDSGEPVDTVLKCMFILMDKFGYTINSKGFKLLPPCIRLIQGDGIDLPMIKKILEALLVAGISASNIAFGMGGGLLQKVDRDTYKFAMKCNAVYGLNGWEDVYKDPITDPGKRSKRGVLKVTEFKQTVRAEEPGTNILVPFYSDLGKYYRDDTLAEIRKRAW